MGVLILLFLLQMGMLRTVLLSCLVSLSVLRLSDSDFVENRERVIDSYVCLKTTVDRTARVSEHLHITIDSLQTMFNIISEIMGEEEMSAMYE